MKYYCRNLTHDFRCKKCVEEDYHENEYPEVCFFKNTNYPEKYSREFCKRFEEDIGETRFISYEFKAGSGAEREIKAMATDGTDLEGKHLLH